MSKKLIAVAAAAALALTGLVGIPASAAVSIAYSTADSPSGDISENPQLTAASATALIDVPANNQLEYTSTNGRSSLMKAVVDTTVGQVVKVDTTGKVRVIDEPTNGTNKYTSASGLTTWTKTATSTSVTFYVYTTGTDAGSVKTTIGGNTSEVFLKGTAGEAYNLVVTFPALVPTGGTAEVTAQVTDVFGNTADSSYDVYGYSTGTGQNGVDDLEWDATDKNWQGDIYASSTAGPFAVSYELDNDPSDVTGLPKAVKSAFKIMDSTSLTATITALTAQVAALNATIAGLVSDYNKLAKRANKKFGKKKAALK